MSIKTLLRRQRHYDVLPDEGGSTQSPPQPRGYRPLPPQPNLELELRNGGALGSLPSPTGTASTTSSYSSHSSRPSASSSHVSHGSSLHGSLGKRDVAHHAHRAHGLQTERAAGYPRDYYTRAEDEYMDGGVAPEYSNPFEAPPPAPAVNIALPSNAELCATYGHDMPRRGILRSLRQNASNECRRCGWRPEQGGVYRLSSN